MRRASFTVSKKNLFSHWACSRIRIAWYNMQDSVNFRKKTIQFICNRNFFVIFIRYIYNFLATITNWPCLRAAVHSYTHIESMFVTVLFVKNYFVITFRVYLLIYSVEFVKAAYFAIYFFDFKSFAFSM